MAIPRTPAFIGQIPVFGPDPDKGDRSDFRNVPASDRGNADYSDQGLLGNYSPDLEPYRDPPDVRHFAGYGATEADLNRGYVEPTIREQPAYDLSDYKSRWTQPREAFDDQGQTDITESHWDFRSRNQKSRGFLTRPRIPTERG